MSVLQRPAGLLELVPDQVYRLGGLVAIDDRLTWKAPGSRGFDPVNAYVLIEDRRAVLVDTGITVHRDLIREQLRSLRDRFDELRVFTTRFEPDCLINLDLVIREFGIEEVAGGSIHNPFDLFENLAPEEVVKATFDIDVRRVRPGEHLNLGPGRSVPMLPTVLRVLPTFWLHDEATGTLFTSDSFGHAHVPGADAAPVISDPAALPDVGAVRAHLMAKFDWFASADPDELRSDLRQCFEGRDVEILAPTHGALTVGRAAVRRHVELLDEALATIGDEGAFR